MQLRTLIEQATQYKTGLSTAEKIEEGRKLLFNFDYPIFDPNYKKVFETNFIRNFYMREIGFETEGLFKFQLETWLQINMPYFNKLFESELLEFDPFENSSVDVTSNKINNKTQNDERNTASSSTSSGKSDSTTDSTVDNFERNIHSNNPDSRLRLSANDGEGVIEYASEITEDSENGKSNSKQNSNVSSKDDGTIKDNLDSNINDVEDFIQHRAGKIGVQTYSEMLTKYRSTFLRIEKQMFDEMQQLFMLVY